MLKNHFGYFVTPSILSAVVATSSVLGAVAAHADATFKGKTLTMLVPYRAGGGTDTVGRIVGEHIAKSLPGKPDIVFRNIAGGGGIKGNNYFANQVKPDGLTAITGGNTIDPKRFKKRAAKYDPRKFLYVGGVARGSTVLLISKDARKRLLDKSKKPVIVGAVDGTRSSLQMVVWATQWLGWNTKWVVGYNGTKELILALQRGETDLTSTGNSFIIKDVIGAGKHEALVQSGTRAGNKIVRRTDFNKLPMFRELMADKLKGQDKVVQEAFRFWQNLAVLDKWIALPPGTPKPKVAAWRAAFEGLRSNSDFNKRIKKVSPDVSLIDAEGQTASVMQVANASPAATGLIESWAKKQGLPVGRTKGKSVSVKIEKIERGGRVLHFKVKGKTHKVRVSSSSTELTIGGKMAARADVKTGMTCKIRYPKSGKKASKVAC